MLTVRARNSGTKKPNGRYEIRVTVTLPDGSKVKKSASGKTLKAAQARADKLRSAKPKSVATTVSGLAALFREHGPYQEYAPKSREAFDWAFQRVEERFGKTPLESLTTPMVYQWVQELGRSNLSGRSVQLVRNALKTVMKFGVLTGHVDRNPASDVPLPRSAKRKAPPVVLPSVVEKAIENDPSPKRRAFWNLLYWSGMRPYKEAAKVGPDDCWEEDGMGWFSVKDSKTDAGVREVCVPMDVYKACLPYLPFGFTPNNTRRDWKLALERVGADYFRVYELRALRNNLWRKMGVDTDVRVGMMGHASEAVSKAHYNKAWREFAKTALSSHYVAGPETPCDDVTGSEETL